MRCHHSYIFNMRLLQLVSFSHWTSSNVRVDKVTRLTIVSQIGQGNVFLLDSSLSTQEVQLGNACRRSSGMRRMRHPSISLTRTVEEEKTYHTTTTNYDDLQLMATSNGSISLQSVLRRQIGRVAFGQAANGAAE